MILRNIPRSLVRRGFRQGCASRAQSPVVERICRNWNERCEIREFGFETLKSSTLYSIVAH
jgi:hypothetical protein